MAESNSKQPDSKNPKGPTLTQLRQARALFEEIASSALAIDRLCFHGAAHGDDSDKYENQILIMRTLISRIGWLADLGMGKADGTGYPDVKGNAENWMLAPSYESTMQGGAA